MKPTWIELDAVEMQVVWDRFYSQFQFQPHFRVFPGFDEPLGSTTFSLSGIYGDEDRYWRIRHGCEAAFLDATRAVVSPGEFLYALDWQHPSYRFWPHGEVEADHLGDWTVPFLPNGDYYCFVDPDLRFGTLGHPWEETLCIFGVQLSGAFEAELIDLLGLPIRKDGIAVRERPPRSREH